MGTSAQVGADVDLFGSLSGEMAGGWLVRSYQDPTLPDISGFIANGTLIWQATALSETRRIFSGVRDDSGTRVRSVYS